MGSSDSLVGTDFSRWVFVGGVQELKEETFFFCSTLHLILLTGESPSSRLHSSLKMCPSEIYVKNCLRLNLSLWGFLVLKKSTNLLKLNLFFFPCSHWNVVDPNWRGVNLKSLKHITYPVKPSFQNKILRMSTYCTQTYFLAFKKKKKFKALRKDYKYVQT